MFNDTYRTHNTILTLDEVDRREDNCRVYNISGEESNDGVGEDGSSGSCHGRWLLRSRDGASGEVDDTILIVLHYRHGQTLVLEVSKIKVWGTNPFF